MLQTWFCCPACHQGLVIIQDVSGNSINCYEIIIAMKGLGWRDYSWEYLPAAFHAESIPWVHVSSTSLAQIVTFSASLLQSIGFLCAPALVGFL